MVNPHGPGSLLHRWFVPGILAPDADSR